MSYLRCTMHGRTVLGIAARASNAEPQLIGELWRQFQAMGGHAIVEARVDDAVYCLYCEYESDATGPFTVVIGYEVAADATVPEGLKKVVIEAGEFAIFPVNGPLPMGIVATWQEVWQAPLERRYAADYDRYAQDGTATVHVGVR